MSESWAERQYRLKQEAGTVLPKMHGNPRKPVVHRARSLRVRVRTIARLKPPPAPRPKPVPKSKPAPRERTDEPKPQRKGPPTDKPVTLDPVIARSRQERREWRLERRRELGYGVPLDEIE